jgi:hypothetical protein
VDGWVLKAIIALFIFVASSGLPRLLRRDETLELFNNHVSKMGVNSFKAARVRHALAPAIILYIPTIHIYICKIGFQNRFGKLGERGSIYYWKDEVYFFKS